MRAELELGRPGVRLFLRNAGTENGEKWAVSVAYSPGSPSHLSARTIDIQAQLDPSSASPLAREAQIIRTPAAALAQTGKLGRGRLSCRSADATQGWPLDRTWAEVNRRPWLRAQHETEESLGIARLDLYA
ncbi:MAG TPA: hypothetical protein VI455_08600 [Terriglobia bacterium]